MDEADDAAAKAREALKDRVQNLFLCVFCFGSLIAYLWLMSTDWSSTDWWICMRCVFAFALIAYVVWHVWSMYTACHRLCLRQSRQRDLAIRVMSAGKWQARATCVWLSAEKLLLVLLHLWKLRFRLEVVTPWTFFIFALYTFFACRESFIFDAELQRLLTEQWLWKAVFHILFEFLNTKITAEKTQALTRFIKQNESWNAFKTQYCDLFDIRLKITKIISMQEDEIDEIDKSNASVKVRQDARDNQKQMEISETNINTFPFLLCIFMPIRVFICVFACVIYNLVQWDAKERKDACLDRMRDEREKQMHEYKQMYGSTD